MNTIKFPAANFCVYCGTTEPPLTNEHIIPYGLWGTYVLPKSSCKICQKIIGIFETYCMRGMLGNFRIIEKSPTQHNKKRPKILFMPDPKQSNSRKLIAVENFPSFIHLPKVHAPPTIFVGGNGNQTQLSIWGSVVKDDIEKIPDKSDGSITLQIHVQYFLRMLAKIAHCYTYATQQKIIELNGFQMLLSPYILQAKRNPFLLIGCIPYEDFVEKHIRHRMQCFIKRIDKVDYLCANIQLFANRDAPMYQVIVAKFEHKSRHSPMINLD